MATPNTFLYNNARHLFASQQLNWATSPINAMLVSAGYAPNLTDQYVSAIPGGAIVVRDLVLTSLAESAGVCSGVIPQMNALLSPAPITALILYSKLANDGISPLIYYSSDGVGFPFLATGFNYSVAFDQTYAGFFQL
jgi:hypothetical protein